MEASPGVWYRLCSAATGNYADSCRFAKPFEVEASAYTPLVRMTAPAGTRMRLRVIDADGLLPSSQSTRANIDPLLLHVFAEESITRTRIPLQIAPSAASNAFEASVVIPTRMNWNVAMSSTRAQLVDATGNTYQANAPIPRPASDGGSEVLAVFTLRSK